MNKNNITIILVLIFFLISAIGAEAETPHAALSVGSGSGRAGDTGISVPVTLASSDGAQVSGLNFELNFNTSSLSVSGATIGAAASSADKSLQATYPSAGKVRILIYGFNQTAIPNGTLANIVFNVNANASPGNSLLSLSDAAASDPGGASVLLNLSNGSFTVIADPTSTPVPPSSDTPTPTNTQYPTNTFEPPISSTATNTHTPTATLAAAGDATQTATNTSSDSVYSSPTQTPTLISTSEITPDSTPILEMILTATIEADVSSSSDEAVSKEVAQSIKTSIMATVTALAGLDAQAAATGTALAVAAGDANGPSGDSLVAGGFSLSNPVMWLAIFGVGASVLALVLLGARAVLKRRSASYQRM